MTRLQRRPDGTKKDRERKPRMKIFINEKNDPPRRAAPLPSSLVDDRGEASGKVSAGTEVKLCRCLFHPLMGTLERHSIHKQEREWLPSVLKKTMQVVDQELTKVSIEPSVYPFNNSIGSIPHRESRGSSVTFF
jgi:hypothetical protein